MSKRRAAQAARQNIRKQLIDGPHITEYSEIKSSDLVFKPKIQIKKEPVLEDEETTYAWQHSPMEDEEGDDQEDGPDNSPNIAGNYEEAESKSAKTSGVKPTSSPKAQPKMKLFESPSKQNGDKSNVAAAVSESTDHPGAIKKLKVPGNMQVKVIRACPKCTPVVMELASQANKASKINQELKKSLAEAQKNVENTRRIKLLLHETIDKNKTLDRSIATLREMNVPFTEKVLKSDLLMQIYIGMSTCNQFNWLFEKVISRFIRASLIKLKAIKLSGQEQLLLVLMFLRCNPSLDELAYKFQFRINHANFAELLSLWLPGLAEELKARIVKGPTCLLNTNFPICFEPIGRNLQGVIHKCEIIREKTPIWDEGQTSHCLKCMVAFSPKGSIMGVSEVVDQTAFDVELFSKSVLSKLFSTTNIIVDTQAIGLEEEVPFGVKILQPPFGSEMGEEALEHIETMVERLMEFRILQGPVIRTVTKPMMDNIVVICCGLVNLHVDLHVL